MAECGLSPRLANTSPLSRTLPDPLVLLEVDARSLINMSASLTLSASQVVLVLCVLSNLVASASGRAMDGESLDTYVRPSSDCLGREGEGGLLDIRSITACLSLCDLEDDLSPPCDLDLSCDLLLELLSPCDLLEDLSL